MNCADTCGRKEVNLKKRFQPTKMPKTCQTFDLAEKINLYTLTNDSKTLTVKITDYGATIVQILFNDRENIERDLVLGFDDLNGYKSSLNRYFGATIGRVANRIANGSFELNGQRYNLYKNNGPNSLHGGLVGFDKRKWKLAENSNDDSDDCLALQYTSYDHEEGYPGTLETVVRFTVTDSNELKINYQSKLRVDHNSGPKKQTIVSLTNHSYFNLNGANSPESASILDHQVRLYSSEYLEVDEHAIPTGRILSVVGTPLELNKHDQPALAIGDRRFPYDHCLVLEHDPSEWDELQKRFSRPDQKCGRKIGAEVFAPRTGIQMTFETDEPSFQFYSGGHLSPGLRPKRSQSSDQTFTFGANSGFCLESQRFVNAINVDPWRVQMILDHDQIYTQNTVYRFEIKDQI